MSEQVIDFPAPIELTQEQREYWEQELEAAQRRSEYAARMLGLIATEKGLEG